MGLVDEISSAEGRLGCEDQAQLGKHRTEVTEGSGWWTKFLLRRGGLGARTRRNGESIAQRSRRGLGLVDEISSAEGRPGCENQAQRGKHRTEVTEVTEGDWVGGRLGQLSLR